MMRQLPRRPFGKLSTIFHLVVVCLSLCAAAQAQTSRVTLRFDFNDTTLIVGDTSQLRVVAVSDGSGSDIEGADGIAGDDITDHAATEYTSSHPGVATVSPGGLITAVGAGQMTITVRNTEIDPGFTPTATINITVNAIADTDSDGMTDEYELQNELDPNNPADAGQDADGDELTNLQESVRGTNPRNADTDGDGTRDNVEVAQSSDPLNPLSPPPLNENCTASIQNRTVQINSNGTYAIPNVPVEQGFYRVRVVCRDVDGTTKGGQTEFFPMVGLNGQNLPRIRVGGQIDPIPVSIRLTAPRTLLTLVGQTSQLTATATLPDNTSKDLSHRSDGTAYTTSNPSIATVGEDGLVTAAGRGQVIISARNEGVLASIAIDVSVPDDADGDGMPDDYERVNGLNPNDGSDAAEDPDSDGLTSHQEFTLNTNPRAADTDGDALTDGAEIARGTDPLRADGDGDGLPDGQEISLGTNPRAADTDGDGVSDGVELRLNLNPLAADQTTTVQGIVLDANNTPAGGVSAIVYNLFTATTDDNGFFRIQRVPASLGPVSVLAQAIRGGQVFAGMSPSVAPFAGATTDVGTFQIVLDSGTVSGLVTDLQNRPVFGAHVRVVVGADVRTATTDATGRYRVSGLVSGGVNVTARDPATSLRGRAAGVLITNLSTSVDVRLGPTGTVSGTVYNRDGVSAAGLGVSVRLSGPTSLTVTTNALGGYQFDFVPLGGYTVEASDAAGNRGRANATLTATGQVVVSNVTYLGKGTVSGTVRDGAGTPVADVPVTLNSRSIFGGAFNATTGSDGRYTVSDVFIGQYDVSARSPITRLGGQSSGRIDVDGQSVTTDITLTSSGSLSGTVFRSGGTTPVAGAEVRLYPTGLTVPTNAQGQFRFDFLPLGSYVVDATDPATGDRGQATGAISSQDEVRNVNVVLRGQGTVVVTVRDGAGALVEGAQVTLNSQTQLGGTQTAATQADGTATFARVLAGSFSVSALDPRTQLSGTASGNVGVGATTNIQIQLQRFGAISGTVRAANGTPAAGVIVRTSGGPASRQTNSGADGSYRLDFLPTGTYAVEAIDGLGNVRARNIGVTIVTQGQQVTSDLTLIVAGTVTGRVTNPNATPAPNITVTLSSQAIGFTTPFTTRTDANGDYTIAQVPLGAFTASANTRIGEQEFSGQATGQIATDGVTVTANIQLAVSLVPTTRTFYDASNYSYDIQSNGSIQDGTTNVFRGDGSANRGGLLLDIIQGGAAQRFTGQALGSPQLGGRQIAIQQENLAGLNVTRKVYVPRTGYFARYLEVLSNPTAAPITVDVRVTSNFRFIRKVQGGFTFDREPRIVGTSSGDALLDITSPDARDHWVTIDDDEDLDPFVATNNLPPVAHVFDGPGASQQAGHAQFNLNFGAQYGQLVEEWRGVTIEPGGSVALLHFTSEQTERTSAQASAARLTLLPPEALTGLSTAELTQIRNFAVPSNGLSTVEPLPALNGTVDGSVLAADNTTLIPNARVTFKSGNPLFARTHDFFADGGGEFRRAAAFNDFGSSVAIPQTSFTLRATHPLSNVQSPPTLGTFLPGLITATQNIVFTNSGMVSGVVRRTEDTVASSGAVQVSGGLLPAPFQVGIAGDGSYLVSAIAAGSYTLTANVPHPQGTALTAATSAQAVEGQNTVANINLPATGAVTGFVRRGSNEVVINVPVELRTANFVRSTRTDTSGAFSFPDVPAGPYTLSAFEQATNIAASAQVSVAVNQTTQQDLNLVTGGSVIGLVTRAGAAVSGAQVALTAVNGNFSTTTGADGRYRFDSVSLGAFTVTATDPASGFHGRNTGSIGVSGQIVTANIQLIPTGTVTGTIFRAGSTTPAAGMQVSIFPDSFYGSLIANTTSDIEGRYTVEFVPVGGFRVEVSDPATGDRGRTTNQINANGEIRTINVTLNGQGRVVVTVRDSANNLVSGAQVRVNSQTQFGGTQTAETQTDGTATFERVLAGQFSVVATDPATNLSGSATGTVTVGATANVAVQLQPAGTIQGRVLDVDGTTPVGDVSVRLLNNNFYYNIVREMRTAPDGSYSFEAVPLGTYHVDARDATNRLRARVNNLTLTANAQVIAQDLTFVGLGTIVGQVFNPNNTLAPNVSVTVQSSNPQIGGFFSTFTNAQGDYTVTGVPVGAFTATATNSSQQLRGETTGQMTAHQETVRADIRLLNNAINLPVNRWDANNLFYNIQRNGSILDGTNNVFRGDFSQNQGAFLLDVFVGGTPNRFNGGTIGTTEEAGREIAVRQQNIAGLDVTRKVFVPTDGYFTRYLEILTNPTAAPITVDVRVLSNYQTYYAYYYGLPGVTATSSDDATLDVTDAANPDRWVVIDDNTDGDPWQIGTSPAVVFAFDGPGAPERVAEASLGGTTGGQLTYQWNNITIAPGQTVAYMHFGAQQTSRAAARASAERLAQLPPEALAGLSPEETAQIRNFAVPTDGVSSVAPLPALNGTITGFVLAADATTGVPSTQVRFKSNHALFGRTYSASSSATGGFTFTSRFNNSGSSIAIPVDGFTLTASHPQTGVEATPVTGAFGVGQNTATQNIVFENTGVVRGTLRRHTGVAVTGGFVQLYRGSPYLNITVNVAADGTFALTGIPAGTYTLTGYLSNTQGTDLSQAVPVTVLVGQITVADITLPPTGTVAGTVRSASGTPVANVYVRLFSTTGAYIDRAVFTNATGQFTFADAPVRTLVVEAYEPNSGVPSTANVTVVQDQTVTQDLTLVGLGQAQVQVNFASGAPAPGAQVNLRVPNQYYWFNFVGYTDSGGRLTVGNVPVGTFIIRAFNPNNTSLYTDVEGVMTSNGQVVPLTVVLPGTGVVSGRVTNPDGASAINSYVEVYGSDVPSRGAYTDSNGNYSITQVRVGRPFSVRAYTPSFEFSRAVDGHILNTDSETLTVNVTLPALATVRVRVLRSDGSDYANARIEIRDSQNNYYFRTVGYTDAGGSLDIQQVPEGDFFVRAYDSSTYVSAGSASGTVRLVDHNQIVEVTINAPRAGNVEGTVYAADGQTPIVSAYVQIIDVSTEEHLNGTYTDDQGFYRFTGVAPGNDGFRVQAHSPNDYNVYASAIGNIPDTGESVTVNVTLPVSVITGTVRYADGTTPAPYPDVFVSFRDANGNMRSHYSHNEKEDGSYTVIGVPVGDFTLMAQDSDSGLSKTITGNLADINTPLTVNVTLPPAGTVTGTVRDASGVVVPYAAVALSSSGLAFENYSSADEQGVFTFQRIPLGTFIVQATNHNYTLFGLSAGTLATEGETVTVNVALPQAGTVRGRVFLADGTTPVINADVRVENFNNSGPLGYHYTRVRTDAAGDYEVTGVQVGQVSVTVYNPNDYRSVGLAQGVLQAGTPATINVVLGSAVSLDYNLDGADGFRYDVDYDGSLNDGGTVDRTLTNAYNGAYYLTLHLGDVYGYDYFSPNNNVGVLEDGDRELLIGPSYAAMGGLSVRRKVFVPAAGGFARFLEVLSNPTSAPLTVSFQVETYFGNYQDIRLVVSPTETEGRFAITDNQGGCCSPALGHVFAGPGASTAVSFSHLAVGPDSYGEMLTRYTVTVPAGETRILMHFGVQRGATDAAGARAQAEALVNLTDPAALAGMSAAEKAQVLNFNVPQN